MQRKRVLVLMGGISTEREVSLRSGITVANALCQVGYDVDTLDVNRDNISKILEINPDVVYIALHGKGGEDGCIQGVLELMGIPYTGPGISASAICMDKILTKRIVLQAGIPTPSFAEYSRAECACLENVADELVKTLGLPMVIKAPCQGSSIGVVMVYRKEDIAGAITEALKYDERILAEHFVEGTEVSVPVIGNKCPELLPIVEITAANEFYDYQSKYTPGMSDHIIPARISKETEEQIRKYAVQAYQTIGCKGNSRIDFIIDKCGVPYLIEINTIPGMTETSLVPDSVKHSSITLPQFVDKMVQLAIEEKKETDAKWQTTMLNN